MNIGFWYAVDFRSERTLSVGTASAASLAVLSPGSSARAIQTGVPLCAPINLIHYPYIHLEYSYHLGRNYALYYC